MSKFLPATLTLLLIFLANATTKADFFEMLQVQDDPVNIDYPVSTAP